MSVYLYNHDTLERTVRGGNALLTTFYGALLANLLFIPLAGKLGVYSKNEILAMEMIVEGICAISRGENPTVVREKMQSFVSPGNREEVKATI